MSDEKEKHDLRVWNIINPPNDPDFYPVRSVEKAVVLINALANSQLFVDSISCNIFGLQKYDGDEWTEWESETGEDITSILDGDEPSMSLWTVDYSSDGWNIYRNGDLFCEDDLVALLNNLEERNDKLEEIEDEWKSRFHDDPNACPTWYNTCNCTADACAAANERADDAENILLNAWMTYSIPATVNGNEHRVPDDLGEPPSVMKDIQDALMAASKIDRRGFPKNLKVFTDDEDHIWIALSLDDLEKQMLELVDEFDRERWREIPGDQIVPYGPPKARKTAAEWAKFGSGILVARE